MEQSETRAAAEIAHASLVVKVAGRDALPVRAIPYVTGWSISPDVVASQFARASNDGFEKLERTDTYHQRDGRVVKLLPKEWDAYMAALEGLEAELKGKYQNHDEGYAAWVSRAVGKLPAGVFVWLDEFIDDWNLDFGPERLSIMDERPGDRDLNLSPFLDNETLNMVLENFGPRYPFMSYQGDDIVAGLAEKVHNGRLIDWEYWVMKMPKLGAGDAARLMAGLDPELYEDLGARPVPKNDPSRACANAKRIEKLALAQNLDHLSPEQWLQWARENNFSVHSGFFLASRGRHLQDNEAQVLAQMPRPEALIWEHGSEANGGRRQVTTDYADHLSTIVVTFPEFVVEVEERLARWRRGRYEVIEAAQALARANGLDAKQLAIQMDDAIHSGQLVYRLNNIPLDSQRIPREHLWHRTVLEGDVNAWLAASGAGYQLEYPYPATRVSVSNANFDFRLHATRHQLIEAFGRFTDMDMTWFKNIKDTPALLGARKSPGQGGRRIREPYFCPFEVMVWLVSTTRKKGRRLSEERGWELLERYFPSVYAKYGAGDPRK